MRARGASPSSVRNIVYRGVGTPADKAALRAILQELAQELGCALPEAPPPRPALPPELDLLGRSKIRAYRQFVAGVRASRAPRLIVAGRPGAGKTVLLTQVARTLRDQGLPVTQLTLSGDLQGVLPLGTPPGASFAAQAQAQQDAARRALPTRGPCWCGWGATCTGAAPPGPAAAMPWAARPGPFSTCWSGRQRAWRCCWPWTATALRPARPSASNCARPPQPRPART
ncbi:helicase HerA-like domain-containing protein [Deinococcus multiflagellatus]|uniref:Helicase HerA-like domain-containing protein n=1 Tax=Deinococcus multiflagellatus TaxID=1656887 RepID=A0ABW1ZGG2_9DEIO